MLDWPNKRVREIAIKINGAQELTPNSPVSHQDR